MSGRDCCRKRTGGTFTENGLGTECSFCRFFCTEEDAFCTDTIRTKNRMKPETDPKNKSFGHPYLMCSKKVEPCRYPEGGDQGTIHGPLCEHGKPSCLLMISKGRKFFACGERVGKCSFFKWLKEEPKDWGETTPPIPLEKR